MNCRREYIEEKGYSYLNNNVLNEYALWLEQKLTETNHALQLLQPDVSKSFFCQHKLVLDCKEQCFKCQKITNEQ